MQGRLLLVVVLAATLAGCGGSVPAAPAEDRPTVTPLPVPESDGTRSNPAGVVDSAVDGNGSVDGEQLGAAHADTLDPGYTRVVDLAVAGPDGRHLAYRGARTVGASGDVLREREYRGPWTARYVPDATNATSARSVRYETDGDSAQRRTVDGTTARTDGGEVPALEAPVPPLADAAFVAALLDDATVAERTESGGARLTGTAVDGAVVPDPFGPPRNVSVRATVRGSGRVTHVALRYETTVDGERRTVTQDVYWSPPSVPVVRPGWAEDG